MHEKWRLLLCIAYLVLEQNVRRVQDVQETRTRYAVNLDCIRMQVDVYAQVLLILWQTFLSFFHQMLKWKFALRPKRGGHWTFREVVPSPSPGDQWSSRINRWEEEGEWLQGSKQPSVMWTSMGLEEEGLVLGGADKVIKTNTQGDDWTDNGGVCAGSKCLEWLHEPWLCVFTFPSGI